MNDSRLKERVCGCFWMVGVHRVVGVLMDLHAKFKGGPIRIVRGDSRAANYHGLLFCKCGLACLGLRGVDGAIQPVAERKGDIEILRRHQCSVVVHSV